MKRFVSTSLAWMVVFAMAHAEQASPDPSKAFGGRWNLSARNGPSATLDLTVEGAAARGTVVMNRQSVTLAGRMNTDALALTPTTQKNADEWQTTWDVRVGADGVMHAKESSCADTSNGYMCKFLEFTGQRAK